MDKIIITGTSGYCGSKLAALLKVKYEVIGLDKIPGMHTTRITSLQDLDELKNLTRGVTAIIHTASLHAPHVDQFTKEDFIDTNVKATLYLLEAARENRVRKFIYTSTTSLYGHSLEDPEKAVWVTENLNPKPRDIYDITKIAAEQLCADFHDPEVMQVMSLRVSRFWDEPLENKVFYRMYRGVDVRDVVSAHVRALETSLENFEIFNISAQPLFTEDDLVDLRKDVMKVLEKKAPRLISFYQERGWEIPSFIDRVYVIGKAKYFLDYKPRHNLEEMLTELSAS